MNTNQSKVKAKTLPGFMELMPNEQILFNHMKDTIKDSYEKYGFLPLDTPTIELSDVLLAKAGGETEKQIYRFTKGDNDVSLRFDLTVPLAKFVSIHYNELTFPFRRYQIGKVFRGEKPQKGRFREFYQCDIDIIGDGELSILNDAEIPSVIYSTFKSLGFDNFTIHINNRKLLNGLFDSLNLNNSTEILRIIDKIDKIGDIAVKEELKKLKIEESSIDKILKFILIQGTNSEKINSLHSLNIQNETFKSGLNELETVIKFINILKVPEKFYEIDLKIARGLDYYTGTVYETFLNDYKQIGSVCSGGRYDNLAEYYTDKKLPGVGISIGLTRLFYKLNELNLINSPKSAVSDVIIIPINDDISYSLTVASTLRENNINTELYLSNKKLKAKFKYADRLKIPYVIVIGDEEIKTNILTVKNMKTCSQQSFTLNDFIHYLKESK